MQTPSVSRSTALPMQASELSDSDELLQTLHRMPCTGHLSAKSSIHKKMPTDRLTDCIQANSIQSRKIKEQTKDGKKHQ